MGMPCTGIGAEKLKRPPLPVPLLPRRRGESARSSVSSSLECTRGNIEAREEPRSADFNLRYFSGKSFATVEKVLPLFSAPCRRRTAKSARTPRQFFSRKSQCIVGDDVRSLWYS